MTYVHGDSHIIRWDRSDGTEGALRDRQLVAVGIRAGMQDFSDPPRGALFAACGIRSSPNRVQHNSACLIR